MNKLKLLWVGDAVAQTGFNRVTQNVVSRLKLNHDWDTHVLGINYHGDPHNQPYPIYPAGLGGDIFGLGRLEGMIKGMKPDVVVILNDPWIVRDYLTVIPQGTNVAAYMPVDAPNQSAGKDLNALSLAILYTEFGKKELRLGGFNGQAEVIPHGVDTQLYVPHNKVDVRQRLRFQREHQNLEDVFIVGNVNRNQERKRLDLTIMYFTQWWLDAGMPQDAYLYLHCSNMDQGWNVIDLAKYFGIEKQLIITNPKMTVLNCVKEENMPRIYSTPDVQLSTTLGEGWGLTTHESMACGTPQIVPRYSALGEWPNGAVHYVDVTAFSVTPKGINTIGGVPDKDQTVAAIHKFYVDRDYRKAMGDAARVRATEERFTWDHVAKRFHAALLQTVLDRQHRPMGVEAPKQHGQIREELSELQQG